MWLQFQSHAAPVFECDDSDDNQIKSLPKELANLVTLETLYLCMYIQQDYCIIHEVLSQDTQWFSHNTFVSDKNQIASIPTEIGRMKNLESLDLGTFICF